MPDSAPTGEQLADELVAAARDRGVKLADFLAPLAITRKHGWLAELRRAGRPKPATIARVRALIAGEAVPPRRTYKRQISPGLVATRPHPEPATEPVDRDPCWYCGTRRDLGCRHTDRAQR